MTNEELCEKIRNGDTTALNALWEQTDRLFYTIARSLYARHRERAVACGVEAGDCLQVCWFAFLDAVEAYNRKSEREEKFASFAGFHVRRRVYELLGYRTSKRDPLNGAVSLDAPLPGNNDENITISDTLTDPQSEVPFDTIDGSDIAEEIESIISALPTKQAAAVRGRFWQDKTLAEIGAELGLSPTQIHNQYREAIRKLRRDKRLQEIRDDYYANTTLTKHTGFQFFKENQMSSVEWHLIRLEERLERAKGGGDNIE